MIKLEVMSPKGDVISELKNLIKNGEALQRSNFESINNWRKAVVDFLHTSFMENEVAKDFGINLGLKARSWDAHGRVASFSEEVPRALKELRKIVMNLEGSDPGDPEQFPNRLRASNRIFIVHGHNEAITHEVARVLTTLGLEPIILREQPNQGRSVFEKLEKYSDVNFAVILMTKDDRGAKNSDAEVGDFRARARQNVILELGFFAAHLTRKNVCVLKEEGVEEPSDILGIVYTPLDPYGAWKTTLAKELRAAGHEIDLNRL